MALFRRARAATRRATLNSHPPTFPRTQFAFRARTKNTAWNASSASWRREWSAGTSPAPLPRAARREAQMRPRRGLGRIGVTIQNLQRPRPRLLAYEQECVPQVRAATDTFTSGFNNEVPANAAARFKLFHFFRRSVVVRDLPAIGKLLQHQREPPASEFLLRLLLLLENQLKLAAGDRRGCRSTPRREAH